MFEKQVATRSTYPFLYRNPLHQRAILPLTAEHRLHLHALNHRQRLILSYFLAGLYLDAQNRAWHRCCDDSAANASLAGIDAGRALDPFWGCELQAVLLAAEEEGDDGIADTAAG